MKNIENNTEAAILRQKAEELLNKRNVKSGSQLSDYEVLKLVHELEVHQIELELMNEEFFEAKEMAAQLAAEKYAELYDFAPIGHFTLSREGRIIGLNLYGSQMLGKERANLINHSFAGFVSDETKPTFNSFLDQVFYSKSKETCELTLSNMDKPTHLILTGIVVANSEELVVTAIDITERKRAEQESLIVNKELAFHNKEKEIRTAELISAKEKAEKNDRLKTAFLANMSHEIRTPLNGILGFVELLKEPAITREQNYEYLRVIEKSGKQMLNTINDIIDIAKIESEHVIITTSATNINDKLEYIYSFYKEETKRKGIRLNFKNGLPTKEALIRTDSEKIYTILTNLIKNAIKYCEKGSIEFGYNLKPVKTKSDGELFEPDTIDTIGAFGELVEPVEPVEPVELEFFVKDTGIGIPKNRHQTIFDRFVQSDISDKNLYGASGLGLAISKAYVELLGGKIWVESEEGKGSVFHFTHPYYAEPEDESDGKNLISVDEAIAQIKKLKILIAEDDKDSEMLLEMNVEKFSKNILTAKTGVEAVEICRNNPDLDLILMDIKMPEMDGYEATRQIRKFNIGAIIIAQTAYALTGEREKAIEAGCTDYIAKPIKKKKLVSLVQKYF